MAAAVSYLLCAVVAKNMQLFLKKKTENKQLKITPKLELPRSNSLHQPVATAGDPDPQDLLPVMPGYPVIF